MRAKLTSLSSQYTPLSRVDEIPNLIEPIGEVIKSSHENTAIISPQASPPALQTFPLSSHYPSTFQISPAVPDFPCSYPPRVTALDGARGSVASIVSAYRPFSDNLKYLIGRGVMSTRLSTSGFSCGARGARQSETGASGLELLICPAISNLQLGNRCSQLTYTPSTEPTSLCRP